EKAPPAMPGSAPPASHAGGDGDRESAALPGLPRLFFADPPDQRQQPVGSNSDGQPPGAGQDALPGRPAGMGQQTGPGSEPQPGQPNGFGQAWQRQPAGARSAQRHRRTRPTRQPDRELRQRAIASLALGGLSLFALFAIGGNLRRFVYLLIFSAVIGVAAAAIGITAVVKARRTGTYRPRGAVGGIVLGALAALLSIPILALYLAFPRQVNNYVTCLNQAHTAGNERACMDKFYRSVHLGSPRLGSGAAARPRWTSAGPARSDPRARLAQGSADGPRGR